VKAENIRQILDLLTSEYGAKKWRVNSSPLSVLVQTILSQNTSDTNSGRAFKTLLATFGNWDGVSAATEDEIVDSIRVGGLGEIKTKRIKQALGEIKRERGNLELGFLNELPLADARDWLKQLPGVGTKTANCVLLFSLRRPALPVDTHVYRVSKRLGLVDSSTSVEKAHTLLESMVPPEDVYQFHVLLIEHGRRVCKAQRPRCPQCVLQEICPSHERSTGEVSGGIAKDV